MINQRIPFLLAMMAITSAMAVIPPTGVNNLYKNIPALQAITGSTQLDSLSFNWSAISDVSATEWQVIRYDKSGFIAQIVGSPISSFTPLSTDEVIIDRIMSLIEKLSPFFGLSESNFQVVRLNRFSEFTSIFVQPEFEGKKLYGSLMAFSFSSAGSLVSVKGRGFGSNLRGGFSIGYDRAIEIAHQYSKLSGVESHTGKIWLPILRGSDVEIRATIKVELIPNDPALRPVIYVDAENGEVLAAENAVVYDRVDGQFRGEFLPLHPRGGIDEAPFPYEFIRIENTERFSDRNGDFGIEVNANNAPYDIYSELRGRWVNVNYEDGADATYRFRMQNAGEIDVMWDDDNSRLDERGLYFHTNLIHSYWKELDQNFVGMDYPVPATCMVGNNYDNAYWNGQGMFFGDGNQRDNFALLSDIIYHEYGHGVTGHIYPRGVLPYTGESGALNEAWSDYFPCSISNEPLVGEGGRRGGSIRNLDNDFVHNPPNWGEVHQDSRIISAAMWHSREILGADITDPLFHFARYHYGNDFLGYFTDVLITDDDDGNITNGSPNGYTLYEQFGRHGIGPGALPDFRTKTFLYDDDSDGAEGNQNNQWEAGESIRLEIELYRAGTLFPPAAENVRIEISTDHPAIELIRSQVNYGDMRVDNRRRGEGSFLIQISDEAELSFANFAMRITASNDFIEESIFRIPLGRPPILLVQDGRGEIDHSAFFEESLDQNDLVYDQLELADPMFPVLERLMAFSTIIWFTGDEETELLQPSDRVALEEFLDAGGNLLLTGQSAGDAGGIDEFYRDYLGVENTIDSIHHFDVLGVDGDPVSDGLWLLLTGGPGAMNQRRPGAIRAIEPAVEILHWTDRGLNEPAAGVRRIDPDRNSKTIFLSFGLEAVSGRGPTDNHEVALRRMLQWLDVPVNVPEKSPIPLTFEILTPFPNPFNSAITLQVRFNREETINFSVYDLSGRLINSGEIIGKIGLNEWSIDSSAWGSGLYFANVKGHYQQQTFRLVHLK